MKRLGVFFMDSGACLVCEPVLNVDSECFLVCERAVISNSLSFDCTVEKRRVIKSGNVIRALHQSMNFEDRRPSIDGVGRSSIDLAASPSRMRPGSPRVLMTSSTGSLPMIGKMSTIRNFETIASETPSVLSFSVDDRRRKVGENRIVDAHLLRVLHNRQFILLLLIAPTGFGFWKAIGLELDLKTNHCNSKKRKEASSVLAKGVGKSMRIVADALKAMSQQDILSIKKSGQIFYSMLEAL
ncbi:hypothetical protein L2E82_31098 [Cichorium intybus]|uniref:Uncharacterized protein n=1 Tax=Cichorium intybus TaxID=13427 RepID=A0ACB9D2K6_CICIN|nr:hypothetical protein L2E82_31098 [Cichorium intybus]